jgi:hypothetical protein
MLNVLDGQVASAGIIVSGPPAAVESGGAIEMVMDYDSQKCYIAVYTPEAVAAGYPQPPRSVTQLEFVGRAYPVDDALYPAVSLYMGGVSVRVEEASTDVAPGGSVGGFGAPVAPVVTTAQPDPRAAPLSPLLNR